ncbi:MAG TPA: RNA polymerase sigma factor [Gemmatimonadaceae bacterium]|nr:RNA polymerase sigma factor [Gemmatimonadaceae bacterium]
MSVLTPVDFHDERALITQLRAGDITAERFFYETHVVAVYRFAVRVTRDPELARDCTQDTFLRAFERLAQFRGEGPVAAWLRTIAHSIVLNRLEKEAAWHRRSVVLDEVVNDRAVAWDPLDVEAPERHEQLTHTLARLPVAPRGLLFLFYVEGYSHHEIAATLGISVGASKVRLLRARIQLRSLLEAERTCSPQTGFPGVTARHDRGRSMKDVFPGVPRACKRINNVHKNI